jgi:hypothetical protein
MNTLMSEAALAVAEVLKSRKHTVAVAESSSGGLISAALLAVPGASAYFLGGAVVYTGKARMALMGIPRRAPLARTSAPPGACPRPGLLGPPAIPTVTPPATPAWRCPAPSRWPSP